MIQPERVRLLVPQALYCVSCICNTLDEAQCVGGGTCKGVGVCRWNAKHSAKCSRRSPARIPSNIKSQRAYRPIGVAQASSDQELSRRQKKNREGGNRA